MPMEITIRYAIKHTKLSKIGETANIFDLFIHISGKIAMLTGLSHR